MNLLTRARMLGVLLLLALAAPFAQAASFTNYYENRQADCLVRGQTCVAPAVTYWGLATSAGSDAGCGTEVTGGSYARVAVTSSLANWAGTQSAGSTTASTGTGGTTSNNNAITWSPNPSASWGTVQEFCGFEHGLTTLSAAISTTGATSMTVTSAAQFPGSGNYYVLIDSEIVQVTGGQGTTTWTIVRGALGTTAATHSNGAAVGGLALVREALTTSKTINSGDTVSFPAGALTIQIDN